MATKDIDTVSENLYQKLAKIRKRVEVLQKDKQGYGYKYVTDEAILSQITGLMDKLHISLFPAIVPCTAECRVPDLTKTKIGKVGDKYEIYEENINDVIVYADMVFTWVNNDNPEEKIDVPWWIIGQQSDASQAFGSGLTYSNRYFLLKFFNVSTVDDDPDSWRSKQKEAEDMENKMLAGQIITVIDNKIKEYLKDKKHDPAEVKKFATKFVKGGNYFEIDNPELAKKMLDQFEVEFLNPKTTSNKVEKEK